MAWMTKREWAIGVAVVLAAGSMLLIGLDHPEMAKIPAVGVIGALALAWLHFER